MAKARTLIGSVLFLCATGAIAQAALEPHRAAYRLKLAGKNPASTLSDVRGGLVIEWRLACDGWLSRQRLGFVAATDQGQDFTHDVRFSSWEATDGSRLRYTVRSYEGGVLEEEFRGEAWLELKGGGGVASFSAPREETIPLPPGTIFPTEHLQQVLIDAEGGKRLVSHAVFDGWGVDALTQITTVIGPSLTLKPLAAEVSSNDEESRAWPVSMAYYNIKEHADTPEFEASFHLTDKGVLRDLLLDYGDFRLDATLERLELLDRPDC
ncbi:MAG: EipB family protein [Geminicoccaceae bacterium]